MDLEEYLEKLLSAKVDLASKKALKPYIGKYILKETIYYEKDIPLLKPLRGK